MRGNRCLMMTRRADGLVNAIQQTAWRWRANARSLPPLSAGAVWGGAGYSLIADALASAGRDDAKRPGRRSLGFRTLVAAAADGGGASQLGNNGGDAEPSCGGRASGRSRAASQLTLDEERSGRRSILTAVGEVDISTSADLQRALRTARDMGAAEIWLDLTHTTFMDCSGLRVLLEMRTSLREANRRLVLICPAGPVLRLLTLTHTDRDFDIQPTRTAAELAG